MPKRPTDFKQRYGPWALVTGASSGIGRVFALELAKRGLNLLLAARRSDRLRELADELQRAHGVQAVPLEVDLTETGFLAGLNEHVGERDVGLLVNNAGYGKMWSHHESDPRTEADMVLLNCWAPVVLTRRFLPMMIQRGRGGVITLSSVVASTPMPYMSTYSATKVFDLYFGEGLYGELKGTGVDSLVVSPGKTSTEFAEVAGDPTGNNRWSRTPEQVVATALRRLGKTPHAVDGASNRLFMTLGQLFPRRFLLRSVAGAMRKMLRRD